MCWCFFFRELWCCLFFVRCLWRICICILSVWFLIVCFWSWVWVCLWVWILCSWVVLVFVDWVDKLVIVICKVFSLVCRWFVVELVLDLVECICVFVFVWSCVVSCFMRFCKVLLIVCDGIVVVFFFFFSFLRYLWIVVLDLVLFNLMWIVFMEGCWFMVSRVLCVFLILDLYKFVCVMVIFVFDNGLYNMYLYIKLEEIFGDECLYL